MGGELLHMLCSSNKACGKIWEVCVAILKATNYRWSIYPVRVMWYDVSREIPDKAMLKRRLHVLKRLCCREEWPNGFPHYDNMNFSHSANHFETMTYLSQSSQLPLSRALETPRLGINLFQVRLPQSMWRKTTWFLMSERCWPWR